MSDREDVLCVGGVCDGKIVPVDEELLRGGVLRVPVPPTPNSGYYSPHYPAIRPLSTGPEIHDYMLRPLLHATQVPDGVYIGKVWVGMWLPNNGDVLMVEMMERDLLAVLRLVLNLVHLMHGRPAGEFMPSEENEEEMEPCQVSRS